MTHITCQAYSNMVNEEMMAIACSSLVFCVLGVHTWNIKKAKNMQCAYQTISQRQSLTYAQTCCAQQICLGQNALARYCTCQIQL